MTTLARFAALAGITAACFAPSAQAAITAATGDDASTTLSFTLDSSNTTAASLQTYSTSGYATEPVGTTGSFLAAEPEAAATVSFATAVSAVSFLWGTPDSYNYVVVTDADGSTATYTAADLGLSSSDTYVTIFGGTSLITSLTFYSTSPAFEASNFSVATATSAVPEPSNAGLMLAGLAALGGGLVRRRGTRQDR